MSELAGVSDLAPTPSNPEVVADALARAKALASGVPNPIKRPSDESIDEGPIVKRQFHQLASMSDMSEGSLAASTLGVTTEQVLVPDGMVGLIIGRGGEQITRLQVESGCKIQMSQDSQGMAHRLCTLTGTINAIEVERSRIEAIITNEENRANSNGLFLGGGMMMGNVNGGASFEMMVPGRLVARIIGKGGEVIKSLQEETGAKIVVIQDSKEYAEEKPLKISGSPEVVEAAKIRVEQFIAEEEDKLSRDFRNGKGCIAGFRVGSRGLGWSKEDIAQNYDSGYDIAETMTIPSTKVGIVMGKGGETIRMICSESGAHCQVDKSAPDGVRDKSVVIKGRPEAVSRAREMINEKIGGYKFDGGSRGLGYGSSNSSSSIGGQPDYSAQWAEYYRSLGMIKEAEIIEHQSQARAATVQPQPLSDFSAQWAQYYRSVGKLKEAEAIEEQMRMKVAVQPQLGAPGQPVPYGGDIPYGHQGKFY